MLQRGALPRSWEELCRNGTASEQRFHRISAGEGRGSGSA